MNATAIDLVAFVVWPFIGTRYGHRLTWRHGRTRFGRLVWTTGGRFVDGCPVYMPVLGRPPASAHRHELQIPKLGRLVRLPPTAAVTGSARPSQPTTPRRPRSSGVAGRTAQSIP